MPALPANWQATGGGPAGHGASVGGGNFQYDGINANNTEIAVNAIPAKSADVVGLPNFAGTYNNGTLGVGATLTASANGVTTFDGHNLLAGDTVLLVGQTAAAQNGLYTVTSAGTTGAATVLTRVPAMNSSADFPRALVVIGGAGSDFAGTLWVCKATGAPVMGTTALLFDAAGELNEGIDGGAASTVYSGAVTIDGGSA